VLAKQVVPLDATKERMGPNFVGTSRSSAESFGRIVPQQLQHTENTNSTTHNFVVIIPLQMIMTEHYVLSSKKKLKPLHSLYLVFTISELKSFVSFI